MYVIVLKQQVLECLRMDRLEQKIDWLADALMFIIKSQCPFSTTMLEQYHKLFLEPMMKGEEK